MSVCVCVCVCVTERVFHTTVTNNKKQANKQKTHLPLERNVFKNKSLRFEAAKLKPARRFDVLVPLLSPVLFG